MAKITEISLPHYHVKAKPDHIAIGAQIDNHIRQHYSGNLVVRALSMSEKKEPIDVVVSNIIANGTDLTQPGRGVRGYDKHADIDFFAAEHSSQNPIAHHYIEPFYQRPIANGANPLRVDLLLVYDPEKVAVVPYDKGGKTKRDGFKFLDKAKKADALLGVIKVL